MTFARCNLSTARIVSSAVLVCSARRNRSSSARVSLDTLTEVDAALMESGYTACCISSLRLVNVASFNCTPGGAASIDPRSAGSRVRGGEPSGLPTGTRKFIGVRGQRILVPAAKSVDEYIRAAPVETQVLLNRVRGAIRQAAPDADESISYGMPFYSYKGEGGVERRLCYFRLQRGSLGLFFRPRDLKPYAERIAKYASTNSALRFPLDQPIPIPLIKRLVRDAVRRHRARARK